MRQRSDKTVGSHQGILPQHEAAPTPLGLTFGVQLGPVVLKAFEPHHIAQQGEELHEGGSCLLVVVHFFFRALACPAVQDAHLALEAQLGGGREGTSSAPPSPTSTGPWGMDGTLAWRLGCLDAWP